MNNEYKSAKLSFDDRRYKIITKLKFMNVGVAGVILIFLQVYLQSRVNDHAYAKVNHSKWYKNFGAFALAVGTGLFS